MFLKRIQLGLIHVAVTITLLPINSTLNRIMIKELAISATLVAVLASLPYVFSPIQVAIGSFSDRHPLLGWRRTPYILLGLLLCVIGVISAPQIAFLLASNFWLGVLVGITVFGAWGMGFNFATVSYFSLATEISGEKGRSRSVAVMFFMMIVSIITTSLILSHLVASYDPAALVSAFWLVGLAALGIGLIGILGLEPRYRQNAPQGDQHTWGQMTQAILRNPQAARFFVYLMLLLTAILGQDILLEPFAAEAFGLSVQATTRITSVWGTFFLIALVLGGVLEKRVSKFVQARLGAWLGIAAFALIVLSSSSISPNVFYGGVILLGLATGLSTVSNLSLMLDMTTVGNVGLFIGAWGMASALARLCGNLLSGILRDSATQLTGDAVLGYGIVFSIEILLLVVSLFILRQVDVSVFQNTASQQIGFSERAALANEGGV